MPQPPLKGNERLGERGGHLRVVSLSIGRFEAALARRFAARVLRMVADFWVFAENPLTRLRRMVEYTRQPNKAKFEISLA